MRPTSEARPVSARISTPVVQSVKIAAGVLGHPSPQLDSRRVAAKPPASNAPASRMLFHHLPCDGPRSQLVQQARDLVRAADISNDDMIDGRVSIGEQSNLRHDHKAIVFSEGEGAH
jgi:hypothetical protein